MTAREATSKVKKFFTRIALFGTLGGLLIFGADLWRQSGQAAPSQAMRIAAQPMALSPGVPVDLADLVDRVRPAVVSVKVTADRSSARAPSPFEFGPNEFGPNFSFPRQPDRRRRPYEALGSGFIIDPDGFIVTNHHVVNNGKDISIVLSNGQQLSADIVGVDEATDLALLKVSSHESMPYVSFAENDTTRVGDWVVAVGNPFGLGGTVTTGIVSALGRDIGSGPYADFIQIDASINQGNSGGPTFNLEGEVVGVNTAIFSPSGGSVGIGFAISAETAKRIVAQLRQDGVVTRGWLGVQIQTISPDMAAGLDLDQAKGAIITDVLPNSPAEKVDLQVGDVVIAVNDQKVDSPKDLSRLVATLPVGQKAAFDVLRRGNSRTFTVKIERREDTARLASAEGDRQPRATTKRLGLELAPAGSARSRRSPDDGDRRGVLVAGVAPDSEASRKGIRPGDIILEVAQESVQAPQDVIDIVNQMRDADRESVLFLLQSGDRRRFVALRLEQA